MKQAPDEITLWNGLRAGNEAAMEALYLLCYAFLLRYGMQITHDAALSKDYINRVFATLWQKRVILPEVTSPKAYVLVCFKNLLHFRKENKATQMLFFPGDDSFLNKEQDKWSVEETRIELEDQENKKASIERALITLPARQKELIIARFILEKSYEEIAQEFQISIRTVYNSIYEGLKTLRSKFDRNDFQ